MAEETPGAACGPSAASREMLASHWTPVYFSVLGGDGLCITRIPLCFLFHTI